MKAFPEIFSIIDVETSGMRPGSSRVIDVGIIRVEHGKVVETYQTLLNPGTDLPPAIQYLTGIRSEDLVDAPLFEDEALHIQELLKDAVFVAHNVSFDYRFIQSEFRRIGISFTAPTLCTVRLSRALFPGERSHNLDSVIARHGFTCATRHRALPDAQVLYDFIAEVSVTHAGERIAAAVDRCLHGQTSTSTAAISRSTLKELPESAGVYFFYGPEDELLYIGKSKHVRTRARSHFHKSDSRKEQNIQRETTTIQTISTSGELSALLLESALIKQESPILNRALRKKRSLVIARRELDGNGYARVALSRTEAPSPDQDILGVFRTQTQAKGKLRDIAKEHSLCAKLLGIEVASGACFGSQIGSCDGACLGKIAADTYNERLDAAFEKRKVRTWPYAGTVCITEQEQEDRGSIFFIRDWILLGSFTYDEGEFTPLLHSDGAFDYDQYKILARYLLNPKNKRSVQVLAPAAFKKQFALCTGSYEAAIT